VKPIAWKGLAVSLAFIFAMGIVGQALAWQYNNAYIGNSLYGQANGKAWSPYQGTYRGDGFQLSNRVAVAQGEFVKWNSTALSYITGNGENVAITFHSFALDNSCSSFEANSVGWGSNLPNAYMTVEGGRPPCWIRPTEIRVKSGNQGAIVANTAYWGKGQFTEVTSTTKDQKFSVDTYYGGSDNYHQVFCIRLGQTVAVNC
jgi:hypothetical protein